MGERALRELGQALRQVPPETKLRAQRHGGRGPGRQRRGPRARAGGRAVRRAGGSSCGPATRSTSSRWPTCWARSRSSSRSTARSSSVRSRWCGASPAIWRPDEVDAAAATEPPGEAETHRSGRSRTARSPPRPSASRPTAADHGHGSRGPQRDLSVVLEAVPTRHAQFGPPSRPGSWCPSRPVCWPTTTWPKAQAEGPTSTTSPGWSRARPGPARRPDARGAARDARRRTRRQRAAWRVFGDAFDPKRTARPPEAAALRGGRPRRGPRPRRPDRVDRGLPRASGPRRRRPRSSRYVRSWRIRREAARAVLVRELDGERYGHWLDGYLALVRSEAPGMPRRRPHRAAPGARHDAVQGLERLPVPARVRARLCAGRTSPRLHDLRIAGPSGWVHPLEFVREALGRDAGPVIEKASSPCRTTSAGCTTRTSGGPRAFSRRARGRPDRGRERRDRTLPRGPRSGAWPSCAGRSARRGGAYPASPSGARSGGSSRGSDPVALPYRRVGLIARMTLPSW